MTTSGSGGRGPSRRDMIRGAAIAGAAAWTAPVIIESLTSPAAAQSCPNPYFVGAGALSSNAGGTPASVTPVLPFTPQQNDLILIVTSYRGSPESTPASSGYTKITGIVATPTSPGLALRTDVLYKVAGASEGNPTVTIGNTSGSGVAAAAFIYRCVNPSAPFDSTTSPPIGRTAANGATVTTFTAPTYGTVSTPANVLVVNVVGGTNSTGGTLTSGAPWQVRASGGGYATTNGTQFIAVADALKTASGAQVGSSWSAAAANWTGVSFALQL